MNTPSTPAMHTPRHEDEIDLSALLHELWGYKWLLVLTTFVGLSLGIVYALRQPPQYQSNILLQIDSKQGSMAGAGNAAQMLLGGAGGDSSATEMALLSSRFILEPVIQTLGLDVRIMPKPASFFERVMPWKDKKALKVERFEVPQHMLNKPYSLVVEKPGYVSLYDGKQLVVSGAMGSILQAADQQLVLQTVKDMNLPMGTKFKLVKRSDVGVVKGLSAQLKVEEMGAKGRMGAGTGILDISLKGPNGQQIVKVLDAVAETARTKGIQKKAEEASQTLEFLYQQLPVTKKLLEEAETALNKYRAESGKIDIKLQSDLLLQQLAALDKQLGELRLKQVEMQLHFKPTHPMWIALQSQIDGVIAQRKYLEQELKTLPASDQVAVNLMRDVEVKQALYMLLLNKIQELEVVKAGTVSGVHVLSYAKLPDAPLPSKRGLIGLGSAMLGLMAGVMYIFGRKLLSPKVDDPHWSEKHLNLPNVAIVPFCAEQGLGAQLGGKKLPLLAHSHSKNLAIEALRSLRTSLQVTLACAQNNIIGILGVAPSVGKSFVSSNLAYLLAVAGKRVLLIDSDLRKGTVHKYFDLKSKPGLSECLSQHMPLADVLQPTMHENLTVLTRGAYPKDPAELLSSEAFKQLIHHASEHFDVVLFDTAPVLLVTDAVLVGGLAATNFLVLGAGAHQPSDLEIVYKRLQNAGVPVNGTIFNFHKEQTRNYYYGKYYNYSYYYHDETEKDTA